MTGMIVPSRLALFGVMLALAAVVALVAGGGVEGQTLPEPTVTWRANVATISVPAVAGTTGYFFQITNNGDQEAALFSQIVNSPSLVVSLQYATNYDIRVSAQGVAVNTPLRLHDVRLNSPPIPRGAP